MIGNGEVVYDSGSGPTSPASRDPFDSLKSDGGGDDYDDDDPSPSQYSSCGESEFDRYCSANSVMGTPSVCSTSFGPSFNNTDSVESDIGSLKSLENFSLGAKSFHFDSNLEDRKLLNLGFDCLDRGFEDGVIQNEANGLRICGESSGISHEAGSRQESVNLRNDVGDEDMGRMGSEENDGCRSGKNVGGEGNEGCVSELNAVVGLGFDGRDIEREEDGGSSRYGYSEDDDSMYGDGSDDESRGNSYLPRNVLHAEERKVEGGNPLIMNSSVAFGSEDWNDFEQETGGGIGVSSNLNKFQDQGTQELTETDKNTLVMPFGFPSSCEPEQEAVRDVSVTCNQVQGVNDTTEFNKRCPVSVDVLKMEQVPLVEKSPMVIGLNFADDNVEVPNLSVKSEKFACIDENKDSKIQETGSFKVETDPFSDTTNQLCSSCLAKYSENASAEFVEDKKPNSMHSMLENNVIGTSENAPASVDLYEDHQVVKAENFELIEFYDEIVNEMEEILLDADESPGARFPQGNRMFQSQLSLPLRDGGPTASTSGTDDTYPLKTQPQRIDGVEVVGAQQKKGDVSLSERLVGVKEYTVYIIRVQSGNDQWEVERRYRDFYTLYRRLKSFFADQGWNLPSPWSSVEKESRKIFGNASPDVVSERSVLIQECLHSTINSGFFSSPPSPLVWFLCPQDSFLSSPAARTLVPRSTFSNRGADAGNVSSLGKTISLIVEIRPYKTTKQMLEAQHFTCAGCHKHFDDGMTLMRDFVQTLGWGKPRLCEYSGQLFCSSCHTNETAVLPARVLHYWDFTSYPVSQFAKSYLDSIHEQPMLCVSAVNPMLFSKVPALHHVMGFRKKIGTMLPFVRCPFHRTINRGLGSRRYLLESNDFFALRDLIDLSKGAFAALPVMVETVSRKILEHITDQCLVCCDVGVPCSARQACDDPSSLIFPFQEGEIERCSSCESVFHKPCFRKLKNCPCGAQLRVDEVMESGNTLSRKAIGLQLGRRSSSSLRLGLLSGLFSKANPENKKDHKDNDTVILMGSLPSISL